MPGKQSAPEVQLKVVQRNYDNISKLMHCKQQECDKVSAVTHAGTDHRSCVLTCFLCSLV